MLKLPFDWYITFLQIEDDLEENLTYPFCNEPALGYSKVLQSLYQVLWPEYSPRLHHRI